MGQQDEKQRIAELEKVNNELRKQQQYVRRCETVVRDSNDAIIIQDLEGTIIAWNLGAQRMYGYTEKEALGMNIERLTPPGKAAEQREFTRRLISGEDVTSFETQRVAKDGSILDVWLTVTKIVERPSDTIMSTGRDITNPVGIASIERNISSRKAAEAAFEKEQTKFRELFNTMSSGVAIYEAKGNGEDFIIADINKAGETTSKVRREDIIGKSVLQVFPGVRKLGLFDVFGQVWKTGQPQHVPVFQYRDERFSQWVDNQVFKLPSGEIVAVYDDVTERMRVEQALRQNEEMLLGVFSAAPVGICVMKDRVFQRVNRYWRELIGYSETELLGRSTRMLYESDAEHDRVGRELYAHLWDHGFSSTETRLRAKDGSLRNVVLTVAPLMITDPSAGVIVVVDDITGRKKSEEALRISELRYRVLFDRNKDGIFIADPETRMLVDCNKAALELTGYTQEELLSMRADQLHPLEAVHVTMEAFKKQVAGGDVLVEAAVLSKDGKKIPVSINTAIVELQGKLYLMGVFRDITDRKNIERSLRQSEEKYRSIVDNIGIGVALISPQMKILSLNTQMRKWNPRVDLDGDSFCYRSFNNPPREGICSYCPTAKTLKDGLVHEAVTSTPMGDKVFNYRVVSSPVKDESGAIIAAIEMVDDITERRKMEEEARKHLQELEVFYKASVGREERIIELKKELERVKRERKGQAGEI